MAAWPLPSTAMWAAMSDAELAQGSSVVVMGTWAGQSALSLPGSAAAIQVGVVVVSEVLKGAAGQTVVFVAVPDAATLRSSSDIHFRKGDSGLWLLRAHPSGDSGLYLADHPQRFVPAATGAARIQSLRKIVAAG